MIALRTYVSGTDTGLKQLCSWLFGWAIKHSKAEVSFENKSTI